MKPIFLPPRIRTGPNTALYLKLYDGTVFDYSLNNHPGALKGTAAFRYPGVILDGDSDYIEVDDHADFTPALSALSISAWIKMDNATNFAIASKGVIDTDGEWLFYAGASDLLGFILIDESVSKLGADCYIGRYYDSALSASSWIHVVATYDGGTTSASVKLYINGVRVDDNDFESEAGNFVSAEDLNHAIWIGRYDTAYADGIIDDVLIYKKDLTAAEVLDIFNQSKHRYGV